MSFRVIPCHSVSFRVVPCRSVSFRVVPSLLFVCRCWQAGLAPVDYSEHLAASGSEAAGRLAALLKGTEDVDALATGVFFVVTVHDDAQPSP